MKYSPASALLANVLALTVMTLLSPRASSALGETSTEIATSCSKGLLVYENGASLSEFPSSSHLSRSVSIGSESVVSGDTCWTATASVKWLSVQPSGKNLVLTANPSGLKTDVVHMAIVTVQSSNSPAHTATIPVALWVGSSDPGTITLAQSTAAVATNPVEPFAYVSAGSSSVYVFNVYTGQLVKTFKNVAPTVGSMVVSYDGVTLFAVDTTNYQIVALDAKGGKILNRYRLAGPIGSDFSFAYAKPAGHPTLFAPGQGAIDVATGQLVSSPIGNGFYDPLITATPNGARLAIVERGLSPGSIYTYTVSHANTGELSITAVASSTIAGENCQAMAVSQDGLRLYPACGWPYEFDVYDGNTLQQVQTLPAVAYPNNAVMSSNGDFVGGVNGLYETDDVFVFNRKGYSLGVVPTTPQSYSQGQGNNLLATSGDSTRVISATAAVYGSQILMFRPLP
jgi:hypothetical protein